VTSAMAASILGIVHWALLIDRTQTRIAALTHVGTLALGRMHAAIFELMRGDHLRAAQNASPRCSPSPSLKAPLSRPVGRTGR
jgi:hypothetical protein